MKRSLLEKPPYLMGDLKSDAVPPTNTTTRRNSVSVNHSTLGDSQEMRDIIEERNSFDYFIKEIRRNTTNISLFLLES